jgi:hypothetical protein
MNALAMGSLPCSPQGRPAAACPILSRFRTLPGRPTAPLAEP